MNKKELVEKYEYLNHDCFRRVDTSEVLKDLKQLDEPEKVTIPQFVAEYIEKSRLKGWDLLASMCFVLNEKNKKTTKWLYLGENKNIFALAWVFGYEVEEEKRFRVKVKGICGNHETLNCEKHSGKWLFSDREENSLYDTKFTRKELEEAGFGEVFNSPLFEVVEVEE